MESQFHPQHPNWQEDLPASTAPITGIAQAVHGDISWTDEIYLEVSRASTLMRGGGLAFGSVGAIFFLIGVVFLALLLVDKDVTGNDAILPAAGLLIGLSALAWSTLLALRLDLSIPMDRHVRFNRARRKVYIYEQAYGANPFIKWPTQIKEFDWNDLHAEIHRQTGFSGKTYVQRFALWVVSCRPGTNQVVDRFELKGNWPTTEELHRTWTYCRQYMEHGMEDLPAYPPRRQEITFRRSLFEYMRFLDPTTEGREVRQRMTWGDWAFNVPFIALTFWLFIPMGVCHFIAMRFAPEAKWPLEIDTASRNA